MARLWQYQRTAAPVPPPGQEAETVLTSGWQVQHPQPDRRRALRNAAFIAAIPAFFFVSVVQAAPSTPELRDHVQIVQPSPRAPGLSHLATSTFFVEVHQDQPVTFGLQPIFRKVDLRHFYPSFFAPADLDFGGPPPTDWNSLGARGTAQSGITGSSLAVTTTDDINAGEVAVVIVACDNVEANDVEDPEDIVSVTDSAGNEYVRAKSYRNGNFSFVTGASVGIFYSRLKATLPSGGTITATFFISVPGKAMGVHAFSIVAGRGVAQDGSAVRSDDAADPGAISLSGLSGVERLWLHAVAHEGPNTDSFTQDPDYTDIAGNGTSSGGPDGMSIRGGFRIQAASSDTVDVSYTAADHAQALVALRQVVLGSGEFEAAYRPTEQPPIRPVRRPDQVQAFAFEEVPPAPPSAPDIPTGQISQPLRQPAKTAHLAPSLFAPVSPPAAAPAAPAIPTVQVSQPLPQPAKTAHLAPALFAPGVPPSVPTIPTAQVSQPLAQRARTAHRAPFFFAPVPPPPPPPPAPDYIETTIVQPVRVVRSEAHLTQAFVLDRPIPPAPAAVETYYQMADIPHLIDDFGEDVVISGETVRALVDVVSRKLLSGYASFIRSDVLLLTLYTVDLPSVSIGDTITARLSSRKVFDIQHIDDGALTQLWCGRA